METLMSGYRSGVSQGLSSKDFNARARELSERLGPVAKSERPTAPPRQRRFERAAPVADQAEVDQADSDQADEAKPADDAADA